MKAETCSYVLLFNYILCNKVLLDCKFIYFIDYWNHNGDTSTENLLGAFRNFAKSDY